jgi:hypothetical protein
VRYELRLSRAARRALAETLPESVAAAVWQFVSGPLLDNPHRVGKPLRSEQLRCDRRFGAGNSIMRGSARPTVDHAELARTVAASARDGESAAVRLVPRPI